MEAQGGIDLVVLEESKFLERPNTTVPSWFLTKSCYGLNR